MNIAPSRQSDPTGRIGPLAVLPVFFKMHGKRVVVAGGTQAAAWKAELLAASGASVEVYACEPEADMLALAETGKVKLHRGSWTGEALSGAAIAIADARDDAEAERFHHAGGLHGVPVNIIDRPRYCDFQFGSIVNRSPAVIAISTDGAAPILGQAIRRRIETLLPPQLAQWAELARDLRAAVMARLALPSARRWFWEAFSDRAFSGKAPEGDMEALFDRARSVDAAKGRVTLVGAGPGDAENLTLKAVRALQSADVILFDDLVSPQVLELARREAKRMLVGKRGSRESCRQEDINEMMVTFARAGRHVVRLKGGDPTIFGRAGEEMELLKRHRIAAEIVPGVTSATAMAAAMGVSLTHRDHAQSVRFVTGHNRHGKLPDSVNWNAVAEPNTTTIFYMGGRTASRIQESLILAGVSSKMPVVVMKGIARPKQQSWSGTLSELSNSVARMGLDEPLLIGVGEVFLNSAATLANCCNTTNFREKQQSS